MNKMLSFAKCKYKIFNAVDGNLVMANKKHILEYLDTDKEAKVMITSNPDPKNCKHFTIDSSKLDLVLDLNGLVDKHKNLEPRYNGTTGLKLTHYIIMRELEYSKSTKPLLILEDDADIEADFVNIIEETLMNMTEEWDIILLTQRYWRDETRPYNPKTKLQGMLFFYGTYGMIVNGSKTGKKIADFIMNCPVKLPIDNYYGDLSKEGKLICYAYCNYIVTHLGNLFESSIGTSFKCNPRKLNQSLYALANQE